MASVFIDVPPMTSPASLLLGFYFAILVSLSVYGLHRCYLVYLYTKYRRPVSSLTTAQTVSRTSALASSDVPFVTVQLPIYNEMYVVDRLIDAVASLDHPRDRLEIQVLDDSTDETQRIAQQAVDRAAARGLDIRYLHRSHRTGFKAGALAEGLRQARGELIAIFDADFVPPSDFLVRVLGPFRDPGVGMVQARWGHINRDYSLLTRVQSIFLDAHLSWSTGPDTVPVCSSISMVPPGVAAPSDRIGGWLATRHTDRRPRSQLSCSAGWLAFRVS